MSTTDDLIKEIDRLQALTCDSNDLSDTMRVGSECYQGTMTLLNTVYGRGSAQENDLVKMGGSAFNLAGSVAVARVLLPALQGAPASLRVAIEGGLIGSLELRGAGISLGDMLTLAKDALCDSAEGSNDVAAVLTAAAFEDTLRRLAETLASVEGRPDLQDVISALKRESVLVGPSVATAAGYLKFRNDALHRTGKTSSPPSPAVASHSWSTCSCNTSHRRVTLAARLSCPTAARRSASFTMS